MQYSSYLQTGHWKTKRLEKLTDRPFCQICKSSKGLHVHHKVYKDTKGESILFREQLSNLITLCASCHSLCHRYIHGMLKINKRICRIRRLMELDVKKNKAFWIVGTPNMWESLYPKILEVKAR